MELKSVGRLISSSWERGQEKFLNLRSRAHFLAPTVLGMPIRGPLIQFYRNDDTFETELSLVNYMSYFSPDEAVTQAYSLTVYNREGKSLASAQVDLKPGETFQQNLSTLFAGKLDHFGVFAVNTSYFPKYSKKIEFLGETSPQFMTLFVPKDGMSGPQMIHSHKRFETWPVPVGKSTRASGCVEDLRELTKLDIFILNSGPARIKGRIQFNDLSTKAPLKTMEFQAAGHGVAQLTLEKTELQSMNAPVSMRIDHNRLIQQRKPILFRTTKSGFVSCNHL